MAAKTQDEATNQDVQTQVSHSPGGVGKVPDFQEEAQQVLAREDQALLIRHCWHHAGHVSIAIGVHGVVLETAVRLKIMGNPKSQDMELTCCRTQCCLALCIPWCCQAAALNA